MVIAPTALRMLEEITDRRLRTQISNRIDGLAHDPEQQGKPLTGDLAGTRSLRAAAARYRIVYRVERGRVTVLIVAVGIRRDGGRQDIYELARKIIQAGLA